MTFFSVILDVVLSAAPALAVGTDIITGIPGPVDPNTTDGILAYIQNLYLLSLGLAGALALGSIVYGAIQYTMSQGNSTKLTEAWDRILQALIGILLLVGASAILTVVNPGLTSLELPSLVEVTPEDIELVRLGNLPEYSVFDRVDYNGNKIQTSKADRKCDTPQTNPKNPCYVGNFQGCSWDPELMSRMCKQESAGGQADIISSCDVCEDNRGFSVGLMQINLISHGTGAGILAKDMPPKCEGLFSGSLARSSTPRPGAPKVCPYRQCRLKAGREKDFQSCLAFLSDVKTNIALSCKLFNARKDGPKKYCDWPHSFNICAGQGKPC